MAITRNDSTTTGTSRGSDSITDSVETISDLRVYTGSADTIIVQGYYAAGDNGGGEFYWDSASTDTDDGGVVIQSTGVTTGRWKRIHDGGYDPVWFGAKQDGVTDDTAAINACIAASGVTGTQTYDLAGASDRIFGKGSGPSPTTDRYPNIYIEKFTNSDSAGGNAWDQGGLTVRATKNGGTSPMAGLTSIAFKTVAETGDVIGIHGRAKGQAPLTSGGVGNGYVYGGWFVATAEAGTAGSPGHASGIEVNVSNGGENAGHWDSGVPLTTKVMTTGIWINMTTAAIPYEGTAAIGITGRVDSRWHTGVFIKQDSIVPTPGVGEGVYIEGGSTAAKAFGGFRTNGHLTYGLNMKSSTIVNQAAIQLADLHQIQLGDTNDAAMLYVGATGGLRLQTTAATDPIKLQIGGVETFRVDNNSSVGNTRFLIYDNDNGALERVSVGAADSGGTGYKVLRILN